MPQISCLFRNVFNTNYKVCYKYKFNTPNMAKWPNLMIIRVLVPPEVLYNHMWAVMNAYNRVDFEFPVAIRASLPSATTCLERPYLLGPLGGRYIQVLLYILFYWYDVLRCSVMNGWCMVWCVEMQCDEWVMHSMMQCVLNGWCMGDALVVWCVMWMNEWMYEWMVNKWACGQCRMTVHFVVFYLYL